MATITARFRTKCPTCGGTIQPGSDVEWTQGERARHAACAAGGPPPARPAPSRPARPSRPRSTRPAPTRRRDPGPGEERISHRASLGAYQVGATIHAEKVAGGGGPDGRYWTVVSAWRERACEDLGQYDDLEWALVRPATDVECAPVIARLAAYRARKVCEAALEAALRWDASGVTSVGDVGRLPSAAETESTLVLGRKIGASGAVTDGGTTYALTAEAVVAHHGGYYDDYRSSTRTAPRTARLADLLRALATDDRDALMVLADESENQNT